MDGADDVGPREVEVLVAPLEARPAEVVSREIPRLNLGAHGAVHKQNAALEGLGELEGGVGHALILAQ